MLLVNRRYRVLAVVGRGSHATVLRVEDRRADDQLLALKLLSRGQPSDLLRWEFAQLRRLSHRNLARVYDLDQVTRVEGAGPIGVEPGALFVTQELVAGQPADLVFEGVDFGPDGEGRSRWVARLAGAVCRALGFLHRRGVVHRDVKPANIVVDQDPGEARLIDLALSSVAAGGPAAPPAGSVAFMAPEALAGRAEPRSDLFALGVTLYRLLTGQLPFGGEGGDVATTLRAILEGRRLPLDQREVAGVSPGLCALIESMLAIEPGARPASARAALLELGRLFGPELMGLEAGPAGVVDLTDPAGEAELDWPALSRAGALIGRQGELELLSTLLEERLDPLGHGSPVLAVAGPEGVGKTALLREATQQLTLRAVAGGAPPPLLLRGDLRALSLALLAESEPAPSCPRLAAWLGQPGGELEAEGAPPEAAALAEELAALASAVAAERPVLLLLESGASGVAVELIGYLHRSAEVLGLRGGDSPRLALAVELRVEPGQAPPLQLRGVPVVDVRPLSDEAIRLIAADRLGEALSAPLAAAVVDGARGRPRQLFTFLAQAAALGPLSSLDVATLARVRLPGGGASPLEGALQALPAAEGDTLLALALFGQSAGAGELSALLELDRDEAVERLGGLWRKGFLEPTGDGAMRLPLAADIAPLAQRRGKRWVRQVHLRALALLPPCADGEAGLFSARAHHARLAGVDEADALDLTAGRLLLGAGDPAGAIEHLEAAARAADPALAAEADLTLHRALLAAGRYDRAVERLRGSGRHAEPRGALALARALRLAGALDEARELARAAILDEPIGALALLGRLELDRGEPQRALSLLRETTPGPEDGEDAAAFEEVAGLARLALGEVEAARGHFEACFRRAEGSGGPPDRALLARAHNLLGMAAHHQERWSEAAGHYTEAEALARQLGLVHAAATYGVNVAVARLELGELGPALEPLWRAVTTLAGVGRFPGELAGALYNYASLLLALGDPDNGLRVQERALSAARGVGARHVEAYCGLLGGDLLRRRGAEGDLEGALDAYAGAVARFGEVGARREACLGWLALCETHLALSRQKEARAALVEAEGLLGAEERPSALSARVALTRGRLCLDGALPLEQGSPALEVARQLLRGGDQRELRWRVELAAARLLARLGDDRGAREALGEARAIVAAMAALVPEQYRPRWEADADRKELERFAVSLASTGVQRAVEEPAPGGSPPLRRLLDINKRLNSELRLGRLLDEIIDTIISLTEAERGFLLLRDRDGTLRPRSARNLDKRSLASGELRLSRSIAEQVVASGEPVLTVDARADGRFDTATSVHALRLRSIMAVPLRVKGEVVGAVYVDDRLRPAAFGPGALQLALDVADQAAIAIENARLLSENRRRQRKIEALNRQLQRELDRKRVEVDQLRRELDGQRRSLATKYSYEAIVTRSAAMAKVFHILDRVIESEVPVIIQGESGTGKELVARAIHFNGPRKDRPFVSENCGAIPETLLESILFGHVRGAFTGADRSRQGLFEVASGGTLLLDEISEMSPTMQAKLLRVLQEGELRPVGGDHTEKVDVRVIASSNQDLSDLVRRGLFREDLFYRLKVITVHLPALRDRTEDIPLLVEHFLKKHGGDRLTGVDRTALRSLSTYPWPGNVRQLENEIMRASVLADDVISEEHLSPEIVDGEAGERPGDLDLRAQVSRLERELLVKALERSGGNQSRAAKALGLSRYGLQKKMTRLGMR